MPQSSRGRVYRDGDLVCQCAEVRVSDDPRLGLTAKERRSVEVRFREGVSKALAAELTELRRRRGARCQRFVERVAPITIVIDGGHVVEGRLQAPTIRTFGDLREIEFTVQP